MRYAKAMQTDDQRSPDSAHSTAGGAGNGTGRAAVAFGPGRMEIREYPVLSPEPD